MSRRAGTVMKGGVAQGMVPVLVASALVLLMAASAAEAIKPRFEMTKPHVLSAQARLGVLSDGTLETERAHGALRLSPAIAPPSQRAWRLSEHEPLVIVGRIVNPLLIQEVTIRFSPARDRARGEPARDPGTVVVTVKPDQPAEPCGSGRGSPATAEVIYDNGDGRVETLPPRAVRMACQLSGGRAEVFWRLADVNDP